jgi:hypothetical protein
MLSRELSRCFEHSSIGERRPNPYTLKTSMHPAPFRLSALDRPTVHRLIMLALLAAFVALAVDLVAIYRTGPDSPTHGDGPYFIGLAKSLASGRGYYLAESFWPDLPNVGRAPLWPLILSVPARIFPGANENAILRYTGALLHAACAALMAALAFQFAGSVAAAGAMALLLAIYPAASALVLGGYSETSFLLALILGVILLFEGGWKSYAGAALCGLAVLARSNFVLLPVMLAAAAAVFRPKLLMNGTNLRRFVVACALFGVFPLIWITRNYLVSGGFPVLSAMEGETLYGANNARVAEDLSVWGYWIMPDQIPGEPTKRELARTRTELQVSRYYHDKATAFMRANWYAMPRLIVGKLVRGFVPVPWVPLAASYVAFFFRALVYAAFGAAVLFWRGRHDGYALLITAMFLVTLATTVIYYGVFRFTFCLEPFLFPVIAVAVAGIPGARRREIRRPQFAQSQQS